MLWALMMISHHWLRSWLGAVRQQAITWASVNPDLCRHMASPGHSEPTQCNPFEYDLGIYGCQSPNESKRLDLMDTRKAASAMVLGPYASFSHSSGFIMHKILWYLSPFGQVTPGINNAFTSDHYFRHHDIFVMIVAAYDCPLICAKSLYKPMVKYPQSCIQEYMQMEFQLKVRYFLSRKCR